MQAVADGISDFHVSQRGTRAIELLFYIQKILIDAKFVLSSISQEVCIEDREILKQGFILVNLYIVILFFIRRSIQV